MCWSVFHKCIRKLKNNFLFSDTSSINRVFSSVFEKISHSERQGGKPEIFLSFSQNSSSLNGQIRFGLTIEWPNQVWPFDDDEFNDETANLNNEGQTRYLSTSQLAFFLKRLGSLRTLSTDKNPRKEKQILKDQKKKTRKKKSKAS